MKYKVFGKMLPFLGILLITDWIQGVQSVSTEQDLTLTSEEKQALDQVGLSPKTFDDDKNSLSLINFIDFSSS